MLINSAITKLNEPEGAFVLNLSKFPGGPMNSLERIPPKTMGVYSWFRGFNYPNNPATIYEHLIKDIERDKFAERIGSVKPYYEVAIKSKSWVSDTKKKKIEEALHDQNFRERLLEMLSQSILLQTPLYIGKSSDLQRRIGQHLKEESILRNRFKEAKIEINETMILLIPVRAEISTGEDSHILSEEEFQSEEIIECEDDILMEEIFSRLFCPQYTIRLG